MGQLFESQDMEMATKVLKAILVVSYCETDGHLLGANEDTSCETHRQFLKGLIDPSELEAPIADAKTEEWQPTRPSYKSILEGTDRVEHMWTQWFKRIENQAKEVSELQIGKHDNAVHLPELAIRLKRDIKCFPLWA